MAEAFPVAATSKKAPKAATSGSKKANKRGAGASKERCDHDESDQALSDSMFSEPDYRLEGAAADPSLDQVIK